MKIVTTTLMTLLPLLLAVQACTGAGSNKSAIATDTKSTSKNTLQGYHAIYRDPATGEAQGFCTAYDSASVSVSDGSAVHYETGVGPCPASLAFGSVAVPQFKSCPLRDTAIGAEQTIIYAAVHIGSEVKSAAQLPASFFDSVCYPSVQQSDAELPTKLPAASKALSASQATKGEAFSGACLIKYKNKIMACSEIFVPGITCIDLTQNNSDPDFSSESAEKCPSKDLYKGCISRSDDGKLSQATWFYKGNEQSAESCEGTLVAPPVL